jgi:hypothetical protein
MLSVYAGIYFLEKHPKPYRIPFFNLVVRHIKHLGGDVHLKKISKAYNIYNWKAIRAINNTDGFNIVVELRNPNQILESKEIPFGEFEFKNVKKNLYNDWHISGVYVYSDDNGFVGSVEDVLNIYNKNIIPFRSSLDNPYSQIGLCKNEDVWYAWHKLDFQTMKAFSIGTSTEYGQDIFVPSSHLDLIKHFQELSFSYDRMIAWVDDYPKRIVVRTYRDSNSQDYEQIQFPYPRAWGHGAWTAKSLDDAKVMATEFAEHLPYVFQGGNS